MQGADIWLAGDNVTDPAQDPQELFDRTVGFVLEYENDDPLDPRELSELPDIRLWFVRLDAAYPWLPIVVDWRAGELVRYAAMLVPHQVCLLLLLLPMPPIHHCSPFKYLPPTLVFSMVNIPVTSYEVPSFTANKKEILLDEDRVILG